jgi:hypothetical protein
MAREVGSKTPQRRRRSTAEKPRAVDAFGCLPKVAAIVFVSKIGTASQMFQWAGQKVPASQRRHGREREVSPAKGVVENCTAVL